MWEIQLVQCVMVSVEPSFFRIEVGGAIGLIATLIALYCACAMLSQQVCRCRVTKLIELPREAFPADHLLLAIILKIPTGDQDEDEARFSETGRICPIASPLFRRLVWLWLSLGPSDSHGRQRRPAQRPLTWPSRFLFLLQPEVYLSLWAWHTHGQDLER